MKQVVQSLQLALEKEKSKVKDLKEQVGAHRPAAGLISSSSVSVYFDYQPQVFCLSDEF